jgi:hypothetical protein
MKVFGVSIGTARWGKECSAKKEGERSFGYAKYASSPLLIVAFYVLLSAGAGDKSRNSIRMGHVEQVNK